MSKETSKINCRANALETAAGILRGQIDEIESLREAVLKAEDIEAVHDMRVITRRLRSALRDLTPLLKKKALKKTVKALKSLADALGAARDEDVAVAALETLLEKAEEKTVADHLTEQIDDHHRRRADAQDRLTKILNAATLENLRTKFDTMISESVPKAKGLTFKEMGFTAVENAVRDFCGLSSSLYKPFETDNLHKLRISAKHLRYAIEFFAFCWGKKIKPFAKEIAEMQTFLGEVHDADIRIENICDRLRQGATAENPKNFWLLSEFFAQRRQNYTGALKLWLKWQDEDFIRRLEKIISR